MGSPGHSGAGGRLVPGQTWSWPKALGLRPCHSLEKDASVVSEEAMPECGSSIPGVPAH